MKSRKVFAMLTAFAIAISILPMTVFAAADGSGICPHHTEHTNSCGYPDKYICNFVCEICLEKTQSLIDELPEMAEIQKMSDSEKDEVAELLDGVDEAKLNLSDSGRNLIDWKKYEEASFVLSVPDGWFGGIATKITKSVSDVKTSNPNFAFINESGNYENFMYTDLCTTDDMLEVEPNGDSVYFYLPEGTYTVEEFVDGDWTLTMQVDGVASPELEFTGVSGEFYKIELCNSFTGSPITGCTAELDNIAPKYGKNVTLRISDVTVKKPYAPSDVKYSYKVDDGSWSEERSSNEYTFAPGEVGEHTVHYKLAINTNIPLTGSVTYNVAQAEPSYATPTGVKATYGDTLKDVTLPTATNGVFMWVLPETTTVGEVGTNSFDVKFTPTDTKNYKTIAKITVEIDVAQAEPSYATPTGLKATYGDTLKNVTLPTATNGVFTWVLPETTTVGEVGTNSFDVKFTPTDTKNYKTIKGIKVDIEVAPKPSSGSGTAIYVVKFETNGGSKMSAKSVMSGSKLAEPSAPKRDGYTFVGWYSDKELTKPYKFSTSVKGNITLYAKWEKDGEMPEPTPQPTPTPNVWENPFTDVKNRDWFFENVKYASENGLMNGIEEDEFEPNAPLTRGMLVTILYRLAGEPSVNKSVPFGDISQNSYYKNAVIWAEQNSIVDGVTETEFAPDDNITREQIAVIIYRYAKYMKYDVSVGMDTNILSYEDFEEISEYAIEAMQYAVGSGLMNGKTESTLNPKDNATRAEIAAVLQRFIEGNK